MTTIQFIRTLIECDGCQAKFGGKEGFDSGTEARAEAYAKGWRFPNLISANGTATVRTSDVCPECVPDWQPQRFGQKENRQRILKRSEASQL